MRWKEFCGGIKGYDTLAGASRDSIFNIGVLKSGLPLHESNRNLQLLTLMHSFEANI